MAISFDADGVLINGAHALFLSTVLHNLTHDKTVDEPHIQEVSDTLQEWRESLQ